MQFLPGNIELSRNPFEKVYWNKLKTVLKDEEGILGYKIPGLGTKNRDDIPSFILRSQKYGVVIIDIIGDKVKEIVEDGRFWINEKDEDIPSRDILILSYKRDIQNRLSKSVNLYDFKKDVFKVENLVTELIVFAENTEEEINALEETEDIGAYYMAKNTFDTEIEEFLNDTEIEIEDRIIDEVDSILEGTAVFNKRKKRTVEEAQTRNDLIKKSLHQTFKLDSTQRSIALQIPNGPQRIRGLAGTGKTIILSMKAALTHVENRDSDFNILFCFNTQSMYNQIRENIENYTIEESSSAPNWDKLKVLHAWGGSRVEGVYSMICKMYNIIPKTFYDAKGKGDALQFIYSDLLSQIRDKIQPVFDMVLIDEAQDFPPALFETLFLITKQPKRVIWAYDEFQSLGELKIAETQSVFGLAKDGKPNMTEEMLQGEYEGGIEKDFMLPNSYRTTRKVLMYAHGLGLGLYSKNAKIPMQDKISWVARGYKIIEPNKNRFEDNDHVIVERPQEHSMNILEQLMKESVKYKDDRVITYNAFKTAQSELDYVIDHVKNLVNKDEIEPEEIIIISLDIGNSAEQFAYIRSRLLDLKNPINCISPGFIEKANKFKEKGYVTLTTPYRAKGNESNIVIVLNAQKAIGDRTLRQRNALFVSITRSRGWCFVSGNDNDAVKLETEITQLEKNYPRFDFIFPKKEDYENKLKLISHHDKNLSKAEKNIDEILNDEISIALMIEKAKDNPELLKKLKDMLGEND